MTTAKRIGLAVAVFLLLDAVVVLILVGGGFRSGDEGDWDVEAKPEFVGRGACVDCHEEETRLWTGSHHDLAMQEVNEETVLGDFSGATFTYAGVTSTFFRRDGKFLVTTDGPDGELQEYEIAYTFGVTPLQQYLIRFPAGRIQALNVCWDTRPAEEGGQRWFHLYPDEAVDHEDPLHWTGVYQNWNYMCAECHSTDLRRGYDAETDRYDTRWSEIDVSCEACHGPGSRHVAYSRLAEAGRLPDEDAKKGLVLSLKAAGDWILDPKTGNAKRSPPLASRTMLDACARCHARREPVSPAYEHGRPFLDSHKPALLRETAYHADGQILDEVYVWGSFLQSKMYREGVRCVDCHDAHSMRLREEGNRVCATCHLGTKFDVKKHHGHEPGTPGSACVDCHAPAKSYMVVDPRRDHSFRVPRPDLSDSIGTPNVCNSAACHPGETNAWSAAAIDRWAGKDWRKPHFATVLHAAREARPDAVHLLAKLAADREQPGIVRATALWELGRRPGPSLAEARRRAVEDPDALVRLGGALALDALPPRDRIRPGLRLLEDPVRAVRIEAARVLVPARDLLSGEDRAAYDRGLVEYEAFLLGNADHPEAQMLLGLLHLARDDRPAAETAYRRAMRLSPAHGLIRVNLADLLRLEEREEEGEAILREGLRLVPDDAAQHHALGLVLVRQRRYEDALPHLERSAELRPASPRFAYVLGIAYHSTGRSDRAIEVLAAAQERNRSDREILFALVTIHRDRGDREGAIRWARKLVEAVPGDAGARMLLREMLER